MGGTAIEWRPPRKRSRTQIAFSILSCLHCNAGLRRTELAQSVSLNGAHLARTVYRLEALNIIEERNSRLYLTEKGEKALALLLGYYELMGVDVHQVLGDLCLETTGVW